MGQTGSIAIGEPKEFNVTSFLKTAREGNLERLLLYLKCPGSDVNATNKFSLTAIHLAAKEGHEDIVRELLNRRANTNAVTRRGNTPLHIAAVHNQRAVCKLLLQHGANVNAKCRHGYTALYLAVMENHVDVVKDLLMAGADASIGPNKITPLSIAEVQNYTEIVTLLKRKKTMPSISLSPSEDTASEDSSSIL